MRKSQDFFAGESSGGGGVERHIAVELDLAVMAADIGRIESAEIVRFVLQVERQEQDIAGGMCCICIIGAAEADRDVDVDRVRVGDEIEAFFVVDSEA